MPPENPWFESEWGRLIVGRTEVFGLVLPLQPWTVAILLGVLGLALHVFLRSFARSWLKRQEAGLASILLDVVERWLLWWVLFALILVGAMGVSTLDAGLRAMMVKGARLLYLLTGFIAAATVLFRVLESWAQRNENFAPVYPPLRFILKAVIGVVGLLTVLSQMGIEIGALLATLGVGGLAFALAMKDTLENFIAGLHLMADRPIRERDMVKVHDTGDIGQVEKIGWRSTRIRTLDNNLLVAPNVALASGLITNISAIDPRITIRLQVGVGYETDIERAGAILEEIVNDAIGKVPGIHADAEPKAFLHPGFGASSLDMTLRFYVDDFPNNVPAQDAIRRRIVTRFREEGINIPFPIRTLEWKAGSGPDGNA